MPTFALANEQITNVPKQGEMVEWSITVVLKTTVLRGTGGSNPSLSALNKPVEFSTGYFFVLFGSCDNAQLAEVLLQQYGMRQP